MTTQLGPLDLAWLVVDARLMPMHIGCLQIFDAPPGETAGWPARWHDALLGQPADAAPFNLRMHRRGLGWPTWETISDVDLDYHVQRWALPAPGDASELHALVGELHAHPLDLSKPLWEFHLIEGLEEGRFALYVKMHHAIVDGMAGMRLLTSALSPDARTRAPAPWSRDSALARLPVIDAADMSERPRRLVDWLRGMGHEIGHLSRVSESLAELGWAALHRRHSTLQAPYTAPASPLNQAVSRERTFAGIRLMLPDMRRVAAHAGCSVNDVLLAVCAGALRGYLSTRKTLPAQQLIAGLPVSLRNANDPHIGTAVSFIVAGLGTDLADPMTRLAHIHASTQAAKQHLRALDAAARTEYTLLMMAPFVSELLMGRAGQARPVFNLIVSNVPGPEQPLYINGARLRAMYPLSIVTHGQALNITSLGYRDHLHLGLTADREAVPDIADLARRVADEFDRLRQRCGISF